MKCSQIELKQMTRKMEELNGFPIVYTVTALEMAAKPSQIEAAQRSSKSKRLILFR